MLRALRHLHPLTWAVLLIAGSVLAYGQFLRLEEVGRFKTSGPSRWLGWPDAYAKGSDSGPLVYMGWRCLAVDVGWWFAMMTPPVILSERLARRRFSLSLKAMLSTFAAVGLMLYLCDWDYCWWLIQRRGAFEVALLLAAFCWLTLVALVVANTLAMVWNRSSSTLTRVSSYLFIGLTDLCICLWLCSSGFIQADGRMPGWLPLLLIGAALTMMFGLLVWLSSALKCLLRFRGDTCPANALGLPKCGVPGQHEHGGRAESPLDGSKRLFSEDAKE